MGGGTSKIEKQSQDEPSVYKSSKTHMNKSQAAIVNLMLPLYFVAADITSEEQKLASDSWSLILTDFAPEFLAQKALNREDFKFSSSVVFFYDTFYSRFFDIHPMAKPLFKNGFKSQGNFLVSMITLSLSELSDREKFDRTLIRLAESHSNRGIKAIEYGIVGEVLFYALNKCLGKEYYTCDVHSAWVKVYSRMLRTIVPVAVSMELKDNSMAQTNRLAKQKQGQLPSFSDSLTSTQIVASNVSSTTILNSMSNVMNSGNEKKVTSSTPPTSSYNEIHANAHASVIRMVDHATETDHGELNVTDYDANVNTADNVATSNDHNSHNTHNNISSNLVENKQEPETSDGYQTMINAAAAGGCTFDFASVDADQNNNESSNEEKTTNLAAAAIAQCPHHNKTESNSDDDTNSNKNATNDTNNDTQKAGGDISKCPYHNKK